MTQMMLMRASTSNADGVRKEVSKDDDECIADLVPPWRNGPAKMWYVFLFSN